MIARIWHGVTHASEADEYVEYVNKTGIRDYRATAGNLEVHFLRRVWFYVSYFEACVL